MLLWIYCFRLFFIRTFVCLSISWSTAWNLGSFKVYSLFSYQCTSSILRIDFRSCSATSERIFQSHSSLSSLGDSLFTISYRQPFVNNFLFFFCFFRSGCSRFVSDSQSAWLVYLVSTVLSTTFFDFFELFQQLRKYVYQASGEGGIWTLAPLLTTCTLSRGVPSASLGTSPNK